MACVTGMLLCNPNQDTLLQVEAFSIPAPEFPVFAKCHGDSQDVLTYLSSSFCSGTESRCSDLRDTRGDVWPQVRVLVQVSQLWDKTWHVNKHLKNHRDKRWGRNTPLGPWSSHPEIDVFDNYYNNNHYFILLLLLLKILHGVLCKSCKWQNVMLSDMNNGEIVMNNVAQRARCADVRNWIWTWVSPTEESFCLSAHSGANTICKHYTSLFDFGLLHCQTSAVCHYMQSKSQQTRKTSNYSV